MTAASVFNRLRQQAGAALLAHPLLVSLGVLPAALLIGSLAGMVAAGARFEVEFSRHGEAGRACASSTSPAAKR